MSSLSISLPSKIKQSALLTDSLKNRDKVSNLIVNTLGVLSNFAAQYKRILPKDDSSVLTFIKCLSFVSAGNNLDLAVINIKKSAQIKDVHGEKLSEVKLVRSAMQFFSGILYFSSLGLNWAGTISSFKAVIISSKILSKMTTVLSNSSVLLMLLITSMKLHEQHGFQQELSKKLKEIEGSNLSTQEKEEAIATFLKKQISISQLFQGNLEKKLIKRYNEKLKEEITNSKKPYYKSVDAYVRWHLSQKVSRIEPPKVAYMERVTNRSCIELIKEIDLKQASIGPTIKKVQEVIRKNMMFNSLAIALASIGLLGLAVSFVPGSICVALSTILSLIPTVAFSVIGISDLIQSLRNNKEGLYDRLVLIATGCLGIVTSTALYALTENALVKYAAILFAVIWLSLLYYVSLHLENQPKSA